MSNVLPPPEPPAPPPLHDRSSPGYEMARVKVGGIFQFVAWFAGSIAVILVVLWFARPLLERNHVSNVTLMQPPNAVPPLQPSPGHPTLPWQDMAALRARQQAQLHSAGPLKGDANHRHIPIDQAIDEALKSGTLTKPWQNSATFPYQRPPEEKDTSLPSVENRT